MTETILPLSDQQLGGSPFHLDGDALSWVKSRFAELDTDAKLRQLLFVRCADLSSEAISALASEDWGGIHRFPSFPENELRRSAAQLLESRPIPPLLTADIEFSEKSSIKAGTPFPNQMAVCASSDPDLARKMGRLAAREAGYMGFAASWTPVVDLAINRRSNVVNTRAFSADVDITICFMRAYLQGMADEGFAGCVKHFPGDGIDDRDQHFATTHNTMAMPEWRQSFGRIYRAAIEDGVRMIMAGHITLAAYTAECGENACCPSGMPASLNGDLLKGLLRNELGYNGVIVSDATGMVGFGARGLRRDLVPMCIEHGCDILLFPGDHAEDLSYLKAGLSSGALSQRRLDEAVLRILGLKASIGLHRSPAITPESARQRLLGSEEHSAWSHDVARRAVTLVKDTQSLLPLSPERHRRILLSEMGPRRSPSAPLPSLRVAEILEMRGFEVTRHEPGSPIDASRYDVGLYLVAEEGASGKENLGPQWERLHGPFPKTMDRLWHFLPTVYVSLGTPFLLYHMPECRTFVNGYSAVLPVQEALVDALMGTVDFTGTSPVDAFCGLAEAYE
ncbi:glycoside hydrolase family protein [Agrobacterium tumefaciens str. Cherry 2E-2-2]|nr:glycoside hydrolase family protein [Agrobacterium tumefaciens str. Cherry 2E-2-2]